MVVGGGVLGGEFYKDNKYQKFKCILTLRRLSGSYAIAAAYPSTILLDYS